MKDKKVSTTSTTSSSSSPASPSGAASEADSGYVKSFDEAEDEEDDNNGRLLKQLPVVDSGDAETEISESSDCESTSGRSQYEIEDVLDYVNEVDGTGEMYLIKWKNWDADFNTWEPPGNLINCDDALLRFYFIRKAEVEAQIASQQYVEMKNGKRRRKGTVEIWQIPPDPRPLETRLEAYYKIFKPLANLNKKYLEWSKNRLNNRKDDPLKWDTSKFDQYLNDAVDGKLSVQQLKDLRKQVYYVEIEREKKVLDKLLKEWESQINSVTKNKPLITVENEVDMVKPPVNFQFVTSYIPGPGVVIPDDPPLGCECVGSCYDNRSKCCGKAAGSRFAYSRLKKVIVHVGTPIWECNKLCKCGPTCANRVVQDGSTSRVNLCIFRTSNGCGWGVKTLKPIKRGSFVCLYVGEVIKTEEAERRPNTYLFDLDFNDQKNPLYTVDASKFGSIAHFINHSCSPNLAVYSVWVNCLDPNLPNIALFAVHDIEKGEELSFDYSSQLNSTETFSEEDASSTPSPTKTSKTNCLCGASNCRKFLFA